VIIGVIVILGLYFFSLVSESDKCQTLSDELDHRSVDIDARKASIGGQLDLDGRMASEIDQYNLDIHEYNAECAT
jgi:hypothetical protein